MLGICERCNEPITRQVIFCPDNIHYECLTVEEKKRYNCQYYELFDLGKGREIKLRYEQSGQQIMENSITMEDNEDNVTILTTVKCELCGHTEIVDEEVSDVAYCPFCKILMTRLKSYTQKNLEAFT